jgi:hypothetical protein
MSGAAVVDVIGLRLGEGGDVNMRHAGKLALSLAEGPAHDFDAAETFAAGKFEDLVKTKFRQDGANESEFHTSFQLLTASFVPSERKKRAQFMRYLKSPTADSCGFGEGITQPM